MLIENRSSEIYSDFAKVLMVKAQKLYSSDSLAEKDLVNQDSSLITNSLYALDASVIDLCLSTFPWAKYKSTKSAIKLHTLFDLRGNIPSFIVITDGKGSEQKVMDEVLWQAGAIYLMDRGYIDFKRLHNITTSGAFFVIRLRKGINLYQINYLLILQLLLQTNFIFLAKNCKKPQAVCSYSFHFLQFLSQKYFVS